MKERNWIIIVFIFLCFLLSSNIGDISRVSNMDPEMKRQKEDKKLIFTFVSPLVSHPVWDAAKKGFEDALKELDIGGDFVGPLGINPTEMINQIEIAIASKVDGIITMPIAPVAMRKVIKKAADAKIPVVFVGAEDPKSTSLAFIGTNEGKLGKMGAQAIRKKFNGKPIRAMVMQSTMDASFAIKTRAGYLSAMKGYPDFKLVVNKACNSDMIVAMQEFESSFKAHPEINLVIGICGEAGPAAANVVKEEKLKDKITIIAIDDISETLDLVKDGSIYGTMAQNFYMMGYKGTQILSEFLLSGKKPEKVIYDSGSIFVGKDNINTYKNILYNDK